MTAARMVCAADGKFDREHLEGVDEDTDGHGPWYTAEQWREWNPNEPVRYEYGIAYGNDLGGDEFEPGVWVEVTDEWDPAGGGSHVSEAGDYYRRALGTDAWERISRGSETDS
jgi:hypothetical protein